MVEVVTGNLLPAPRLEAGAFALKKMSNQSTASILQVCLESLSEACLKTALASVQTFFFSLLSTMELAAAARTKKKNEIVGLHLMDGKRDNSAKEIRSSRVDPLLKEASAILKVDFWNFAGQIPKAVHAQYLSYADIRYFTLIVIEKIASKDSNGQSIAWRHALGEDSVSSMLRFNNTLQPLLSIQMSNKSSINFPLVFVQEKYSPDACKLGDDCFLQGPETDVRLSRKEITDWLATAKNKDDEDDEDDDDDDDDDDEEPDDEGEAGEEGDEVEGEEPDDEDDDDDGEEADDGEGDEEDGDGDEGDGDDEEEEDDDGEEDDGEGDEEDGDEGDNGDGDEEDGDDDEDEDDESSEPPKKKRK